MTQGYCPSCHALEKQLKVQKADYEFQLKKIKEDQSTEKAMYEIHLQKQIRKWQEAFQKEKQIRQQENHNWLIKYDQTVAKYEQEKKQLIQDYEEKIKNQKQHLDREHQEAISQNTKVYEEKLDTTIKKHEKNFKMKTEQWNQKDQKTKERHVQILQQMKEEHESKILEMRKRLESEITGLKSELIKQEELHQKSKSSAKEIQTNFHQQIYYFKRDLNDLNAALFEQKSKNEELHFSINILESTINELQEKIKHNYKQANQIKQKQLLEQKNHYLNMIRKYREEQLQFCHQFQSVISKMEDGRATQKQLYLSNVEEIKSIIEARMSRPEDMHEIGQLRSRLLKKTKECEVATDELKWCKLQLENKQETYNKIFVPLQSHHTLNNENSVGRRKQFKFRRQGKSVTTVREILHSMNSNSIANPIEQKKVPLLPKYKLL